MLPTFERATCLEETLRSILCQTEPDFELIVADDGSTDGTLAVVESISDDRIVLLRSEHLGVPAIVNLGLSQTSGSYVIILHDHDYYSPHLLEVLCSLLDRHRTASFAFCGIGVISSDGQRKIGHFVGDYPELMSGMSFLEAELLPGLDCPVSGLTMVRRSALKEPLLNPAYGACADVEWWLSLAEAGDVAYTPTELIDVRARDGEGAFDLAWAELTNNVLTAKGLYLDHIGNRRTRAKIVRTWQRELVSVGLAALLRAMERCDRVAVGKVEAVLRRWGPRALRPLVWGLVRVPPAVSRWFLSSLRSIWHLARSGTPNRVGEAA